MPTLTKATDGQSDQPLRPRDHQLSTAATVAATPTFVCARSCGHTRPRRGQPQDGAGPAADTMPATRAAPPPPRRSQHNSTPLRGVCLFHTSLCSRRAASTAASMAVSCAHANKKENKTDRTSRQTQAGIGHSAPAHNPCMTHGLALGARMGMVSAQHMHAPQQSPPGVLRV